MRCVMAGAVPAEAMAGAVVLGPPWGLLSLRRRSLAWRARVAGGMVGSLFLRSYERSERVYAAMAARGYTGEMRRLNPPPLKGRSIWIGLVPCAALVVIELLAVVWWSR